MREPGADDWEKRAAASAVDAVLEELTNVMMEQIGQRKLALARIEVGSCDFCARSGDAIADARMAVLPQATGCVNCNRAELN